MANLKITLLFALVCGFAFVAAVPAPQQRVAAAPADAQSAATEQLEGSEDAKDLKGSESIGYGYYSGYPGYYGGYPYGSYGYGSYYGGYPYYRPYYGGYYGGYF